MQDALPDALPDALTPGYCTPGSSCVTSSNTTPHMETQGAQTQHFVAAPPASALERGAGGGGMGAARKGMQESKGAETDAERSGGVLGAGVTNAQMRGAFPRVVAWGSAEQRDGALVSLRAALAHVRLP